MLERIVFAGPSLRTPYPDLPDVKFLPPAARGDLMRVATSGARVIGLIDGVFHQSLAVTPAEVRAAAATGARLFGGASLGALRACECPSDMQGVGAIWAAFVRGELTDDDEVAVTFFPESWELVAYPLVQIREVARLIASTSLQCEHLARQFVADIRALPFQERTVSAVRRAAASLIAAGFSWNQIHLWLTDVEFDVKRRDALAVLEAVSSACIEVRFDSTDRREKHSDAPPPGQR